MTQQIRDSLFYNGREYYLNTEILEYYFNEFPEHKPKITGVMTACWRGYIATFEIIKNELIIKDLDWLFDKENDPYHKLLADLFPNNKYGWFSGLIRIDDFRGKYNDEDNEEGIYELLEIREGNFINHWKLGYGDFQEFKKILFSDFKMTVDYEKLFSKWKKNNPGIKNKQIDQYIFDYIIDNVRKI